VNVGNGHESGMSLLGLFEVATRMPLERPLSWPLTLGMVSGVMGGFRRIYVPDALGDSVSGG
jgi:hypothetical protein